jgi:hypothetical protein
LLCKPHSTGKEKFGAINYFRNKTQKQVIDRKLGKAIYEWQISIGKFS